MNYWVAGKVAEAIPYFERGNDFDPMNSEHWAQLAELYRCLGRFDDAEGAMRRAFFIDPDGSWLHQEMAFILISRGDSAAALIEIEKAVDEQARAQGKALLYARGTEADETLRAYEVKYAAQDALGIAEMYASRREKDTAFKWLERSYRNHEANLVFLKTDDFLKELWSDPRFKVLLRKMSLPG
jgi:tetratricopeptide (TPR) repeat protein